MQLQTHQGGYEPMRTSDVGADEATYATTGWVPANRPAAAKLLPVECNGVEIMPYMVDFTADKVGAFQLWGWATNGPAEFLAEISATVGTAQFTTGVGGTAAFCDKLVCTTAGHVKTISLADVGSTNNASKVSFDTAGLKYVHILFTDVSEEWNALIRYW